MKKPREVLHTICAPNNATVECSCGWWISVIRANTDRTQVIRAQTIQAAINQHKLDIENKQRRRNGVAHIWSSI